MNWVVLTSAFLAAAIEVIEMVAIVVAVGAARSWKWSLMGSAGGLVVLAVLVTALGTALRNVPLGPLRLVIGALLLVFGLQWLRKGVIQVARHGLGHRDRRGVGGRLPRRRRSRLDSRRARRSRACRWRDSRSRSSWWPSAARAVRWARPSWARPPRWSRWARSAHSTYTRDRPDPATRPAAVRRSTAVHVRHVLGRRGPRAWLARRRAVPAGCARPLRRQRHDARLRRVRTWQHESDRLSERSDDPITVEAR